VTGKSDGFERFIGLLTPALLLLVWEGAAHFKLIDVRFFPPPSSIVHQIGVLIASGELAANTLASLRRLALGMLLGGVPALFFSASQWVFRARSALRSTRLFPQHTRYRKALFCPWCC
jgi:ABC-type nitrate/sulfonate/bicarbonate transport system permease component